ncbi:MAG: hypothetical protein EAZ61_11705 [Oscillatoriales cyanobacterium]|nr:MAG: hypothetical protein EAZ61_11705 [Oscillatoriales cyanobacterium]
MANPSSDHTPTIGTATTQAVQAQVEFALLDRLHLEDDSPYAWQPLESHPQLDRDASLTDTDLGWTDASIEAGAHRFFSTLDRLWNATSVEVAATPSPRERLWDRFGARVPAELLNTILDRATAITGQLERSGQAAIAQLVSCVDGSIPGWSSDDWRTIARPYALAMRDQSSRSTVSEEVAWDELSKIERAKLSLEITLAALEELQRDDAMLTD